MDHPAKRKGKKKDMVGVGKTNTKKTRIAQLESSSEGEDGERNGEYDFGPAKSFKSIFSKVQSTLHAHKKLNDKELLAKYEDDPIMRSMSLDLFPARSRDKTKPGSKILNSSKVSKIATATKISNTSVVTSSTATSSVRSGATIAVVNYGSLLDQPITESQLAVADLDTDTELDAQDITPSSSRTRRRNGRTKTKVGSKKGTYQEVLIPSDDDPDALDDEFQKFLKSTDEPIVNSSPSASSVQSDIVEVSNVSIYRPPSPILTNMTAFDGSMRIRVRFRGQVHAFEGNRDWDIEQVRRKLSELTDIPESELLLYTENNIKMVDGKTLSEYDVGEGDFLEAMRRGNDTEITTSKNDKRLLEGAITLKFQKSGLRRPLLLEVSKYWSLKEIRRRVAVELKLDEKKLDFIFDGDKVNLNETPEDLDLENDDCIDVHERA